MSDFKSRILLHKFLELVSQANMLLVGVRYDLVMGGAQIETNLANVVLNSFHSV